MGLCLLLVLKLHQCNLNKNNCLFLIVINMQLLCLILHGNRFVLVKGQFGRGNKHCMLAVLSFLSVALKRRNPAICHRIGQFACQKQQLKSAMKIPDRCMPNLNSLIPSELLSYVIIFYSQTGIVLLLFLFLFLCSLMLALTLTFSFPCPSCTFWYACLKLRHLLPAIFFACFLQIAESLLSSDMLISHETAKTNSTLAS